MRLNQFSLKKRFSLIVYVLILLAFMFLLTSINQLKKVSDYNQLIEKTTSLKELGDKMDSLKEIVYSILQRDVNFYKTKESEEVDQLKNINKNFEISINDIGNSFFLHKNPQIENSTLKIKQSIKKYDEFLDEYLRLLNLKGYDGYGLNGEINILVQSLQDNCKKENLAILEQKINELSDIKNEYILKKESSLVTKFQLSNEEAKAYAIITVKNQKLNILTKLQKFEELILKINELDQTIGRTSREGIMKHMKDEKEQIISELEDLTKSIKKEMDEARKWGYFWLAVLFVLLFITILGLRQWLNYFLHKPLHIMKNFIVELVAGKLPEPLTFKHRDEITEMAGYLNNVVDGLKTKAGFATEIGKGKLDSHYQPLSDEDILGNALIEMEKSLQKADLEDQKYKNEEKKRIWSNEGIAKFSEILRLHNNDINMLADETIQNLVKYLNAAQGALFFYNDEEKENIHLELMASFAYDRKKYIRETIKLGEGLVGTAALEKERIFVTDIPPDYMTITSGLGEAPPRSILIVPLKLEDEILGVVELASFDIFEQHEIEFIEKVGQTIASTITSVKMNARTAKLLEQSQRQAEEMAEQEEEMRQNMEELRTTQEDFNRREAEMSSFLTAIQNSAMVFILDDTGKIIDVNDIFLENLHSKREDIIGRLHREFSTLGRSQEDYDLFWDNLKAGRIKTNIEKIRLPEGKEIFLRQTFSPVISNNALVKVLCISNDITEIKNSEKLLGEKSSEVTKLKKELEQTNHAIDNSLIRCEYSLEGRIIYVNDNFCRITGHSRNELIGKINTIYLKEEEKAQFEKIWNEVIKNKPYSGSIKRSKPTGEEIWLVSSFMPINDNDGNIAKIVFMGQDITERKLKYQLLEEANKEIERLKKNKEK